MPLYDYRCPFCGSRREVMLKLAELEAAEVHCLKCDQPTVRQLSAPRVSVDYPGYNCPVTGKWIEGRRAHIENLAATGCRVLEPGEKEGTARARKESDQALDRAVDDHVEQTIHSMDTRKRERLIAEVQGGIDATFVRQSPKR